MFISRESEMRRRSLLSEGRFGEAEPGGNAYIRENAERLLHQKVDSQKPDL